MVIAPDLVTALERALEGDGIALPAGVHSADAGLRLNEVTLVGLDPEETTIAVRTYAEDAPAGYHIMAESRVVLANLLINNETGSTDACGVLVKGGLTMKRCQLTNFDVCVKISPGAMLDATEDCVMRGSRAGVVVEDRGQLSAEDLRLTDCSLVVKDPEGTGLHLKRVRSEVSIVVLKKENEAVLKKAKICDSEGFDESSVVTVDCYRA